MIAGEGAERDDGLGGSLEVSRSGVVTESGPRRQKFWFGSLRQSIHSWVEGEEPFIIGNYGRYAGLLEHDF